MMHSSKITPNGRYANIAAGLLRHAIHEESAASDWGASERIERYRYILDILDGADIPDYDDARKMHHSVRHERGEIIWKYRNRVHKLPAMEANLIAESFIKALGGLAVYLDR